MIILIHGVRIPDGYRLLARIQMRAGQGRFGLDHRRAGLSTRERQFRIMPVIFPSCTTFPWARTSLPGSY